MIFRTAPALLFVIGLACCATTLPTAQPKYTVSINNGTESEQTTASAAAPVSGKLTKQNLVDAQQLSFRLYPQPFENVFQAVTDRIGPPDHAGDNMNEWYALDHGKCFSFFMTKAIPEGTAAVGIYDTTQPKLCQK